MKRSISLTELKGIEKELLDKFDHYCALHGLTYFLAYGTLIGAIRHKGFIPWDDDIDVFMPRKDYELLVSYFNSESEDKNVRVVAHQLDDRYYLPFAKIIDTRTVLKEKTDIDLEIGVYIDIFPLEQLSNNYEKAKAQIRKGFSYNRKLMIKTISISNKRSFIKNLVLTMGKIALKKQSLHEILQEMDSFCKKTNAHESKEHMGVICGISAGNASRVFKSEWFGSVVEVDFEGGKYPAPIGYDSLLRQLYGDYMQLPSIEEQVTHHVFEAWYKEGSDT